MHIGIDARFYSSSFTGIGRYVYELVSHLLKIDTKNHYTLFFNNPQFDAYSPPRSGVTKILADSPYYSFKEQWKFFRLLKHAKLDLVHFTHFNAPLLYTAPSIVTIHDLTLSLYPGKKMNKWWQRLGYHLAVRSTVKKAHKIIAVSENTGRDIVRLLKVPQEKIKVIHEGVNPQFHQIKNTEMVDKFCAQMNLQRPYILYTGVWRSHKNLVNLIRAFAILKHKYKFEGILVITGKEDPWYPEVKETVRKEHLEGTVRFTGLIPDEDLVLLYNGALLYVFPSFYEGFGLPALEAFACGLPVCAANVSSLPEICGEGNAVFFDPHSPADIAEKVASVYKDPVKMAELKARGLDRIKDFSWERMAKETLSLYNEASHVHPDPKNSPSNNK